MRRATFLLVLLPLIFGCQQVVVPPPQKPEYKVSLLPEEENKPPKAEKETKSKTEDSSGVVDLIVISIEKQRLHACAEEEVLREIVVSTGNPNPVGKEESLATPLGEFSICKKDSDHYSQKYKCPMPYAMFFFEGHAIHATEPKFYPRLGTPISHGCVRTRLEDAKWLFEHTPIGAKVIVVP